MSQINPSDQSIFQKFVGRKVTITLSNNYIFYGTLISVDGYMNLAIENLKVNEDYSNDSILNDNLVKESYKLACVRGACVERITLNN